MTIFDHFWLKNSQKWPKNSNFWECLLSLQQNWIEVDTIMCLAVRNNLLDHEKTYECLGIAGKFGIFRFTVAKMAVFRPFLAIFEQKLTKNCHF